MELKLLKCFVVAAEELHFGRAANRLDMLPSALGRNLKLLEESLGRRLFIRSTRNVALTKSGQILLGEARSLLSAADSLIVKMRESTGQEERVFRVGGIDSAATGLIPQLVHDVLEQIPELEISIIEDKTVKLLPKLTSGALDLAFVRPPTRIRASIEFDHLLNEPTIVALPEKHELAALEAVKVTDLKDVPMVVPSPRHRPHSHKMIMQAFLNEGIDPVIAQQADEKQTIVRLIGTGLGAALVPHWTSRFQVDGVVFRKILTSQNEEIRELPLAAAWARGSVDPIRDEIVKMVHTNLEHYTK